MELLSHMKPGDVLADADLSSHVTAMGIGVAEAQKALDYNTIHMLGEFTEPLPTLDNKSLLSLGLSPPFYHLRSAMLSCSVSMGLRVVQSFGGKLNIPGKGAIAKTPDEKPDETSEADTPQNAGPDSPPAGGQGGTGTTTPALQGGDEVPEVLKGIGASASLLDARYARMFDVTTSGNMSIVTELVSIPAPPAFLHYIKAFLAEKEKKEETKETEKAGGE